MAIGPILAVVLVGFGVTWGLTILDNRYGITDRVVAGLDALGDDTKSHIEGMEKGIQDADTEEAINGNQ